MSDLARYHERVSAGDERALAVASLLESAGVSVANHKSAWLDMSGLTYAVTTIEHLSEAYGPENVRVALRLLTETNAENARFIRASVVTALTVLVACPDFGGIGLALFDAMDKVSVEDVLRQSKKLRHGKPEAHVLIGLFAAELRRHLGELA